MTTRLLVSESTYSFSKNQRKQNIISDVPFNFGERYKRLAENENIQNHGQIES